MPHLDACPRPPFEAAQVCGDAAAHLRPRSAGEVWHSAFLGQPKLFQHAQKLRRHAPQVPNKMGQLSNNVGQLLNNVGQLPNNVGQTFQVVAN